MGSDFLTWCTAGAHGTAVSPKGEHSARIHGAHSAGTVAPVEMVSRDALRHMGASANEHQ